MPQARTCDRDGVYYHGTGFADRLEAIRREGIAPQGHLRDPSNPIGAIPGRVYLTRHLAYAQLFAIRDASYDFTRHITEYDGFCELNGGEGKGYLFVIPAEQIHALEPDEDLIAICLARGEPAWLCEAAERSSPRAFYECGRQGNYWMGVQCAKLVLNALSDEQRFDLIDRGGSVACPHSVRPIEGYEIDRSAAGQLRRDGSNFFEHARKVF